MITPALKVAFPSLAGAVVLAEIALWQAAGSPAAWAFENVALILAIIGGVAGYGGLRQRTTDNDRRIAKLEELIASVTERKATRAEVSEHNQRVQHQLDAVLSSIENLSKRIDDVIRQRA